MKIKLNIKSLLLDGITTALCLLMLIGLLMQPSEDQLLNMSQNFYYFLTTFIFGIILSIYLENKNVLTLGTFLFEPPSNKNKIQRPMLKTFWGWQLIVILFLLIVVGTIKIKFSIFELLNIDGFNGAKRLFKGIFTPNWEVLPKAILNIIETIFMAFMATFFAIPFAFVLSFFSAKNVMKGRIGFAIYLFMRTFFNVTRSIEALLWAIIFSVWVGIGPFAGTLALMIHSIASLAKQYSEMIESTNEGPVEGVLSCGANQIQTVWFGIVPQITLPFISFTIYRWDINVRMATIIGLVGGGGIGTMLIEYQGQAMWPEVGTIIVVIAFVVWVMDQASAYIREVLK